MKISVLVTLKVLSLVARTSALMFLFCLAAEISHAQSIDISAPSPVRTNEVVGKIAARDLGDSRLTDHFYAFTGTPGDILVTVESRNLNGDVDLFSAGSLRPLMKFQLYAESSSPVTRAIFLRRREDLILRVEARSPNDDEGIYHIRLGGTFEPVAGNDPVGEADGPTSEPATTVASRGKGSRRVSSVGARIAEPPEEVVAAPTPQPTPEEVAAPAATPEPTVTAEVPASAPSPAPRRGRGRVPPTRTRPASQPANPNEPSGTDTASEGKTTETPAPAPRRTGRRGTANRKPDQIPAPEPETGSRLVIEMHDGTRIERFMSTIRRVTVENNQIVVVRKDGRIERTQMLEVLRVAIEP